MELISPLALLFGLAALVPVVLHLYQRRKRVVVLFSTSRFFTEAIHRAQRRLQWRRLLLLLLRVAACLLLALALARPMMHLGGLGAGRQGHRDLVLLLDDSFSMQTADAATEPAGGHTSRFAAARQHALDALRQLTPGDRAAVLTFTGRALGTPPGSSPALLRRPRRSDRRTGTTPSHLCRRRRLRGLDAGGRGAAKFRRADPLAAGRLRFPVCRSAGATWPQPLYSVATALLPVGSPARHNLVVEQAALGEGTPVVHQPMLLGVRLMNYLPGTVHATLSLQLDDKPLDRRQVALAGESRQEESFPLAFATAGEHRLVVKLDAPDDLPGDNTWYGVVHVEPRLPVLLVDGRGGGGGDQAAAFFLQTALAAASMDRSGVQSELIGPDGLASPSRGLPLRDLEQRAATAGAAGCPLGEVRQQRRRAGCLPGRSGGPNLL